LGRGAWFGGGRGSPGVSFSGGFRSGVGNTSGLRVMLPERMFSVSWGECLLACGADVGRLLWGWVWRSLTLDELLGLAYLDAS
jgi:hypothetical protein